MSLNSGRNVIDGILRDRIKAHHLMVAVDVYCNYGKDSIGVLAYYDGHRYELDFLTHLDLAHLSNLDPDFIWHKFCRMLNLPVEPSQSSPFEKSPELQPTFSLSEIEQAQALIDELSCKAS